MKALITLKNEKCDHSVCPKVIGTNLIHRLGSDPDLSFFFICLYTQ